jgi:uncharacterized damage-inducible protein DinB
MAKGEAGEIREALARALEWEDAHVNLDSAVEGLAPGMRGRAPDGLPHSAWQLVEHIRLTQRDILDFCCDPEYRERSWPDDYWPPVAIPPDDAWEASLAAVREDRTALARLLRDSTRSLVAPIPHGDGQTLLREIVLVIDHTAYHVGQIVAVRKALGAWER